VPINCGTRVSASLCNQASPPLAILRRVYETNVLGVVAVTNAMLPLLRQAPAARIVNVSSDVGSIQATLDPRVPQLMGT
jgi:NAD(P)-dependent dehydrogenase (short-subunit alcohol dehydrogenase family)